MEEMKAIMTKSRQHSYFKEILIILGALCSVVSLYGFSAVLAQEPLITSQPQIPTDTQFLVRTPNPLSVTPSPTRAGAIDTTVSRGASQTSESWSWTEWWMSFTSSALSGVLSSALLAIVLHIAITRPLERRAAKQRKLQLLGMLKSEMETNLERVKKCIELLEPIEDVDSKPLLEKIRMGKFDDVTAEEARSLGEKLPRKYTRGVWNALKEDGFITQLDDPQLIFYLLRTNEAIVVADSSRKTLRLELLKGKTDIDASVQRALLDSKNLLMGLNKVLPLLRAMNLPTFLSGEIPIDEGE